MGHFRESSYAYLLFKNGTILTTITSTTSIHKGKATSATINGEKTSTLFLPVSSKGEGISGSRRARELILGSNWGRIQFPIHWCTLQVTTLWSLQIVCCVLHQEISRNFKGIWDSATLKRFYSTFLQSQFYIKKKKTKLWLIIRRYFIQLTISLHNV